MVEMIPAFRDDGYLPDGIHMSSEPDLTFRFGSSTPRRRRLALRIRRWITLARQTRCLRLLIDGSFVTSKPEPQDVDALVLLAPDFQDQIEQGNDAAIELEQMLLTRHPEEIFAAEDATDWEAWVQFFSRTREADDRRKGLVEVAL